MWAHCSARKGHEGCTRHDPQKVLQHFAQSFPQVAEHHGRGWRGAESVIGSNHQGETTALFNSRWSKWPRPSAAVRRRAGEVGLHSVLVHGIYAARQPNAKCGGLATVTLSVGSQAWNGQEQKVTICSPRDHESDVR